MKTAYRGNASGAVLAKDIFDYLDSESDIYTFSARIVRLKLEDGSTQMLITNLDPTEFPLPALQALYARRWGIETSFRELILISH